MPKSWQDKVHQSQDEAELKRQRWECFSSKLESLQSLKEAKEWVNAEYSQSGSPDLEYYINFAFFLQSSFTVPFNANANERSLYIKFIQRLDETGIFKEGKAEEVLNALQKSLKDHPHT